MRPHLIWGTLGVVLAGCMWWAWSLPGGLGMFACIALAFVLWYRMGPRGSWVAVVAVGVIMSSILGWQAVTGSRCPAPGTEVFLRIDRAPIGCDDVRASAAVMATFFAIIAAMGAFAPVYARKLAELPDEADLRS